MKALLHHTNSAFQSLNACLACNFAIFQSWTKAAWYACGGGLATLRTLRRLPGTLVTVRKPVYGSGAKSVGAPFVFVASIARTLVNEAQTLLYWGGRRNK